MAELLGKKRLLTKKCFCINDPSREISENEMVTACDRLSEKVVCLFFSASWCTPCQHFVPVLKDIYTELRKRDEPLEVVFLSFDKTKEEMAEYYQNAHGDWLAVPFDDPIKKVLAERYSISVIPKLIIVQPNGDIITSKGRKDIQDKGLVCMRTWRSGLIIRGEKLEEVETEQKDDIVQIVA